MAIGPELVVVISASGTVLCTGPNGPEAETGAPLSGWSGVDELVTRARRGDSARGEITAPDDSTGPALAQRIDCGPAEERSVLIVGMTPEEAQQHSVDEAVDLVEQAEAALVDRDEELRRLQRLTEHLLAVGPPTVLVDSRRRVRSWSRAAEDLSGTSARRALGRPLASVLPGVDLSAALGGGVVVSLRDSEVTVAATVLDGDDGDDGDVVLVLEPAP